MENLFLGKDWSSLFLVDDKLIVIYYVCVCVHIYIHVYLHEPIFILRPHTSLFLKHEVSTCLNQHLEPK